MMLPVWLFDNLAVLFVRIRTNNHSIVSGLRFQTEILIILKPESTASYNNDLYVVDRDTKMDV